jgi:hypothetical protein
MHTKSAFAPFVKKPQPINAPEIPRNPFTTMTQEKLDVITKQTEMMRKTIQIARNDAMQFTQNYNKLVTMYTGLQQMYHNQIIINHKMSEELNTLKRKTRADDTDDEPSPKDTRTRRD